MVLQHLERNTYVGHAISTVGSENIVKPLCVRMCVCVCVCVCVCACACACTKCGRQKVRVRVEKDQAVCV